MPTRMLATVPRFARIISLTRVALLTFLSFLLSELTPGGILFCESLSVAGVLAQLIAILLENRGAAPEHNARESAVLAGNAASAGVPPAWSAQRERAVLVNIEIVRAFVTLARCSRPTPNSLVVWTSWRASMIASSRLSSMRFAN